MSVADSLLAPPAASRRYRWSTVVLICAVAGVTTALPEAVALRRVAPLFIGMLEWAVWGALIVPVVDRLASTPFRAFLLAAPVVLAYHFAVADDLFQAVVLYTLSAGDRLLIENAERKLAAEEERQEIAERFAVARVNALLGQLQPHFIFNSLNTVSALAARDPERAAQIAEELRDLFRRSTEVGREVTLADEIEFVSKYVDVQKARFEERLRISYEIGDATETAIVPALILQPLVENAVQHSMTTRDGVSILIRAYVTDDSLHLTVINDGCGTGDGPIVDGVGLSNTRERLQVMYGSRASLLTIRSGKSEFTAAITLPFRS